MRPAFGLIAVGLLALVLQGGLATLIPPPWCPDLALLVVIAIGLRWRHLVGGLCMAAVLGYATDLLSGSLLGQHALLRIFAFAGARLASRQLNLRGAFPLAVFVGGATLAYHLALAAVSGFFTVEAALHWSWGADLLGHALVNAVFAPGVSVFVERLTSWIGNDDVGRRMRLEPRERAA